MAELWHPIVLEKGLSYPSMSDCMVVGISGNCGTGCPVFLAGNCEEPPDAEDQTNGNTSEQEPQ